MKEKKYSSWRKMAFERGLEEQVGFMLEGDKGGKPDSWSL